MYCIDVHRFINMADIEVNIIGISTVLPIDRNNHQGIEDSARFSFSDCSRR